MLSPCSGSEGCVHICIYEWCIHVYIYTCICFYNARYTVTLHAFHCSDSEGCLFPDDSPATLQTWWSVPSRKWSPSLLVSPSLLILTLGKYINKFFHFSMLQVVANFHPGRQGPIHSVVAQLLSSCSVLSLLVYFTFLLVGLLLAYLAALFQSFFKVDCDL